MADSFVERELKFEVAPDFVVPDVTSLVPAGGRIERRTEQLRSDYFDTADHALLRAEMTLRRRTGSADTGWQLKIPQPPFREEIWVPADGAGIPEQLQRLLTGVGRGQRLKRIARVSTQRSVTRLLDEAGVRIAEIDDDVVHATGAGAAAAASSWREVEVELGEAPTEFLAVLSGCLKRAGARRSVSTSKLVRALPATAPAAGARQPSCATQVLAPYLAEQQRVMLAGDLALRRGNDEVIHKTRVATRRLRSALRVYGDLLEPDQVTGLDSELRWYAGLLGAVRDAQVLSQRLDGLLDQLHDSLQLGPVRSRVHTELGREKSEHWKSLQQELSAERYLSLLADVDGFVRNPPWTALAQAPATIVVSRMQRAERTVSRRLRRAAASDDVQLLHGARKAAKRARYAAETAQPVIGKRVTAKHAKHYQKLQDLLGEHQDSLLSADLLRRLGGVAGTTAGENGFAFGILFEREQRNARTAREKAQARAKKY